MSKHFFKAETVDGLLQVQMGWDKPTQNFYCVVFKLEDEERESLTTWEEPIYSNLNEPPQSLEYYVSVCSKLGLNIPEDMVNTILWDCEFDIVNEERHWN